MSTRKDAGCALAVAMLVHVLAIWLVLRDLPPGPMVQPQADTVLEVVWIARRIVPQANAGTVAVRVRPSRAADRARPSSARSRPKTPVSATAPASAETNVDAVASEPTGTALDGRRRVLDLRLREPVISFDRNPLARRAPRIEAHQDRMTLQFSDSSFGGTMQRMAKSKICTELRHALRTAGGGVYGVIGSMQEHGCPI